MRKFLIGGLGVAGLLATVLALASSPATAQTVEVIVFTTDSEPGTYTVNWSTRGGCDPSRPGGDTTLVTDRATGSISRTVSPPAGVAGTASISDPDVETGDGANQGSPVEFSVATAIHCTYDWTASFTSNLPGSDGIRCPIDDYQDGSLDISSDQILSVSDDGCNTVVTITVSVPRGESEPTSGAILNTTFTVGAQQVTANNAATNDECAAVTGETEVDDKDTPDTSDDTVGAELTVVQYPLSDGDHVCAYDVGVVVPGGFAATSPNSEGARITGYIIPASAADTPGGATGPMDYSDCGTERFVGADGQGSDTDDAENTESVTVRCDVGEVEARIAVAVRNIYILQNVVGDSGGANARYTLSEHKTCEIPDDLPENLEAREVGGIDTTDSVTVVELREGIFNISKSVMGSVVDAGTGRSNAPRAALNSQGDACSFTAAVSHLPDGCDAAEDSISVDAVTGADSDGRVIVTFDIGCEAVDDMDDGMDMGDDMGDGMDMGDDMDMGDAMGPPEDVATG